MIHRVRVANFKSIRSVTVNLSPVTVLVGKSGSGKSNFVESIRCLRDILAHEETRVNVHKVWKQLQPAGGKNLVTEFEVEFSIGSSEAEGHFNYFLYLTVNGPNHIVAYERLMFQNKVLFEQKPKRANEAEWSVPPNLVDVPKAGKIAIGRIPSIPEVVLAFAALTTGIGCYVFPV